MSATLDLRGDQEWTPKSLAAWLDEPRDDDLDWRRFEIVDGALVVSPPALPRHEALVIEVGAALRNAVPPGHRVMAASGIEIGRSYLVSDVTVVAVAVLRQATMRIAPADVLLAVEIESRSSITTDRITKPAQYAAAGIRYCWRVETDPVRLMTYELRDGGYAETGAWTADETARVRAPVVVDLDLSTFLPA